MSKLSGVGTGRTDSLPRGNKGVGGMGSEQVGKFRQMVWAYAYAHRHQWAYTVMSEGLPLDFSPEGVAEIDAITRKQCGPVGGVLLGEGLSTPNDEYPYGSHYAHRTGTGRASMWLGINSDEVLMSEFEIFRPQGQKAIRGFAWDISDKVSLELEANLVLPRHLTAAINEIEPLIPFIPALAGMGASIWGCRN